MRDTIIGLHHHDCAEQDGDERGLDREMRRQPRIACAMNWAPLSNPILASQCPVPGSVPPTPRGCRPDLLVGSRHEAGSVVSLSAAFGLAGGAVQLPEMPRTVRQVGRALARGQADRMRPRHGGGPWSVTPWGLPPASSSNHHESGWRVSCGVPAAGSVVDVQRAQPAGDPDQPPLQRAGGSGSVVPVRPARTVAKSPCPLPGVGLSSRRHCRKPTPHPRTRCSPTVTHRSERFGEEL